jgi:hypothetical protein
MDNDGRTDDDDADDDARTHATARRTSNLRLEYSAKRTPPLVLTTKLSRAAMPSYTTEFTKRVAVVLLK